MTLVDEETRPLRVLDLWLHPNDGYLDRVTAMDVTTDDLAEFHDWVVRPGRTTATVSEVYRRVPEHTRLDQGRFVLVGRYRLTPPTD